MPNIKDRIKKLRKEYGFTQESLAKTLGLNAKSSIANYENGSNAPSDEIKLKMCKLFNCSMDYLMGITSYKNPKRILEDKLYKLNVTEQELKSLKDLFNNKNPLELSLLYIKELSNRKSSNERELEILEAVLDVTLDYLPKINDNVYSTEEEEQLNKMIEENMLKMRNLVNSLEEINIISNYKLNQFYMCPVYVQISAAPPFWRDENIVNRIPLDYKMYNLDNANDCFYFKMEDNSLNKIIAKDTYVLFQKQNTANAEDIVLVSIDNKEPVIKKCMKLDKDIAIFQAVSDETSNMDIIMDKQRNYKILGRMIGKININN